TIYVYDQGGAPFATRAYWLLKYAGFDDVKIVQDGYIALVEAGFEVTSETATPAQTSPKLNWQDQLYVDRF
ncbi:MAG: sulfurtransferase, partial [Kurthia sp.]